MNSAAQVMIESVNRHAAVLLQQVNQRVDEGLSPVFQLMRWALGCGEVGVLPNYRGTLETTVESALRLGNQESPVRFLTNGEREDEVRNMKEFLMEQDPLRAGGLLLEELHRKLWLTLPGYR